MNKNQKWTEENKWKLFKQGMDEALEILDRAAHPNYWRNKDAEKKKDFEDLFKDIVQGNSF